MKPSFKSALKISVLSALVIAPALLSMNPASADETGKPAPYVAAGAAVGVTKNGGSNTPFSGQIQGRLPLNVVPLSVRGTVAFNDNTSSVAPQLTYDAKINKNVGAYVGGGYNLVQAQGQNTVLGDKNAPVAVVGVEGHLGNNVNLYLQGQAAFNAYTGTNKTAVGIGAGGGVSF